MFPVIGQKKIEYLRTNSFVCNTVSNLSEIFSKVFDNNNNNNGDNSNESKVE